jgi:mono/diheme cytochrome c family protein
MMSKNNSVIASEAKQSPKMIFVRLPRPLRGLAMTIGIVTVALSLTGCMKDMQDQPRYEPFEKSDFFEDGSSARHLVEGTVYRGGIKTVDEHLNSGKVNGELVSSFPFEVTRAVLDRGEERFNIFCAACHGNSGYGDGMVVQRGFPKPPSYHDERLRDAAEGYLFNVITNGMGKMAGFKSEIPVEDRWAIVAYLRVLQRSQNAGLKDVPATERGAME